MIDDLALALRIKWTDFSCYSSLSIDATKFDTV